MKATITAVLIGIFLLAGVPDIFANPGWGYPPAPLCDCINPFQGTINSYRGDPDSLCGCGGPGWCYVDCNSACRDQQQTASNARCQSTLACCVHRGDCGAKTVC